MSCAWRAAGYPDTGDDRRRQARYEGSDRQARGAVLKILRDASATGIRIDDLLADWPDAHQRDRAITSLADDGLVELDRRDRAPSARLRLTNFGEKHETRTIRRGSSEFRVILRS